MFVCAFPSWAAAARHAAHTIPLSLYQTDRSRPNKSQVEAWRRASPGLRYLFHDDCLGLRYLRRAWGERHARAFSTLRIGAIRSDLLRLCLIAERGGFYSDTDNCAPRAGPSLADLAATGSHLIVTNSSVDVWTGGHGGVFNAFFGAVPRHPALLRLVEEALHNVETRRMGTRVLAPG